LVFLETRARWPEIVFKLLFPRGGV
jgi:hypothetical protein